MIHEVIRLFGLLYISLFIISAFNFGPQHPSTHGVLRLITILFGETVKWLVVEIGLLHRGTEKLIDLYYLNSSIPYFDRFDYVSVISQELLFIHSLERLLTLSVSFYDSIIRSLFLEFYRILNHLLAITTHAIDIGLFTTMLWSFEEREKLIDMIEGSTGNRFHAAYLLLSRLRYDISLRWIECLFYWLIHFTRKLKEIYIILSGSRLWINRLFDIGFIERDYVLYFGLTGLLSRSANIWIDGRLLGYECYQNFNYSIFLGNSSDCLDRYILRFNEMIESSRFIVPFNFLDRYYWVINSFYLLWIIDTVI